MNKKLLVMLVAALVLVSAASCGKNRGKDNETLPPADEETTIDSTGDYIVVTGTDAEGNTTIETIPVEPETDRPIETNPTFVDKTLKVVVIANRGTVRKNPDMNEDSKIAWPAEGTELNVTGESNDWYRLSYGEGVAYITKSIVADAAGLEGFTEVNETVTVTGDVHVRSYPSADSDYSIRGSFKSGATVTRVGIGEKWSRVLFTVSVETESGDKEEVVKEYYINNNYIKTPETVAESTADSAAETNADTAADSETSEA